MQARLTISAGAISGRRRRPERDEGLAEVGEADDEGVAERGAADVGREAELLLHLGAEEDVGVGGEAGGDPFRVGARQAFVLEDQRQLGRLALGFLFDLEPLVGDLRLVQRLLRLAGEEGAAAHRDAAGDRLGEAGDEDRRPPGVRRRHPGDDAERHQQPVLGAEDELADPRRFLDPRRLGQRVLLDVAAAPARPAPLCASSAIALHLPGSRRWQRGVSWS